MIRNGVLKKKMSLRTEVLIASVGSVLLVAVFLSASYIQLMRRIIDRATVNTVSQTMLVLNGQVDAIFKPYEVTVRNVAHAASSHADRNSLAKMVQKAVSSLDTMDNDVYYATTISRYQEGGFYIDGSNWVPGEDWIPSERDWWKDAVRVGDGNVAMGAPYVDAMEGTLCVTLSSPAYDENNRLIGVAAADIYLNNLSNMVREIKLSANSSINIITKDGLYVTNDDFSAIMNKNYFDTVQSKSIIKDEYLDGTVKSFTDGGFFYGVHPIKGTDWFIVTEGPVSDFSAGYFKMLTLVLLGLIVLVAAMVIVDVVASTRLSQGFKEMAAGCERFAKCDFSKKYPDYFTSEASLLSNGFNLFSQRLQDMIGTIKGSSSNLDVVSNNMKESVATVSDSMTSIRLGIENVQTQVEKQSSGFDETSSVIHDVTSSISTVNEMIDSQTRSIRESSSSVSQLVGSIEQIGHSMESMASSFESLDKEARSGMSKQAKVNERISQIEQQSQMLQEANMAIASIAEQTNLLAMNAAIEAAHAGEAGKGFAVVADEIRKLSETSSGQSKTIGEQLKNIQDSIGEIVAASQESSTAFAGVSNRIQETDGLVQSVRNSLEKQNEDSRSVISLLAEMDRTADSVRNASSKMSDGSIRILSAMDKLRTSLGDVRSSMANMSDIAQGVITSGKKLDNCVESLDINVAQLGDDVRKLSG